mmetsp:Transcript_30246/g.34352  ORF Transcript_30246/g.34352 Transcript_30246/m.34352 type:complete len:220 (-) Transcript_30246:457-1116(-)
MAWKILWSLTKSRKFDVQPPVLITYITTVEKVSDRKLFFSARRLSVVLYIITAVIYGWLHGWVNLLPFGIGLICSYPVLCLVAPDNLRAQRHWSGLTFEEGELKSNAVCYVCWFILMVIALWGLSRMPTHLFYIIIMVFAVIAILYFLSLQYLVYLGMKMLVVSHQRKSEYLSENYLKLTGISRKGILPYTFLLKYGDVEMLKKIPKGIIIDVSRFICR